MLNFLLVEDDIDHADLISRLFANAGVAHQIKHLSDGVTALRYLTADGPYQDRPRPDVVLLDLNLPKLSGLDVLERLKHDDQHKTIPVVVLTSSAAETDRIRAYQNHANSYLVKPVEFDKFREMVREMGLYWGVWNQSMPPEATCQQTRGTLHP